MLHRSWTPRAAVGCLLLTALAAGTARAEEPRRADVRLEVVVIRASAEPTPGGAPVVAIELRDVHLPWLRLGFTRYERDRVVARDARFSERVVVGYDSGGKYELVASAGRGDRPASVHVEQRLPGDDEPCLKHDVKAAPKSRHLPFCNVDINGTTWLFVVSAWELGG